MTRPNDGKTSDKSVLQPNTTSKANQLRTSSTDRRPTIKIFFGRGSRLAKLPGNRFYKKTIASNQALYRKNKLKSDKEKIAKGILDYLKDDMGSQFFSSNKNYDWEALSDHEVLKRIKQSLRDDWNKNNRPQKLNKEKDLAAGKEGDSPRVLGKMLVATSSNLEEFTCHDESNHPHHHQQQQQEDGKSSSSIACSENLVYPQTSSSASSSEDSSSDFKCSFGQIKIVENADNSKETISMQTSMNSSNFDHFEVSSVSQMYPLCSPSNYMDQQECSQVDLSPGTIQEPIIPYKEVSSIQYQNEIMDNFGFESVLASNTEMEGLQINPHTIDELPSAHILVKQFEEENFLFFH